MSFPFRAGVVAGCTLLLACTASPQTPLTMPPTFVHPYTPTPTETLVADPPTLPFDLAPQIAITPTLSFRDQTVFGYTYISPDGNRLIAGSGGFNSQSATELKVDGRPIWLVGAALDGGGSIWAAVLEDGRIEAWHILAGHVTSIDLGIEHLPAESPPLLMIYRGAPSLVTGPEDASPRSHPVLILGNPENLAYIDVEGNLVIRIAGQTNQLDIQALPDARLIQDERGYLLVFAGKTQRYPHAVLGDEFEAGRIDLIDPFRAQVVESIRLDSPWVFEGIAPIWVDIDQDGAREILATRSNPETGAQLILYNEAGEVLASGPPAGRGFLWRHQLLIAPFSGDPTMEIVDILTPHTGGTTEFYRWNGANLEVISAAQGFTSHLLGSTNLDMTLAGDFDGDLVPELLIPTETFDTLGALSLASGSVQVVWSLFLGARLSTNLAAVTLSDGTIALGAGLENGVVRLWLP